MKTNISIVLTAALISSAASHLTAENDVKLTVRTIGTTFQLAWQGAFQSSDGSIAQPYFELQRSDDLRSWSPVGERRRAAAPIPGELLTVTVESGEPQRYYRLLSVPKAGKSMIPLASGGAQVFGYSDAFDQELQRIGKLSADEFGEMFAIAPGYLTGLSWDPTTAQFWDLFKDKLNSEELATFKKNGFVVSERLDGRSFGDIFYGLWRSDLPVFISTDALLQAWHRTYDAVLEEIEETYLFDSVQLMLEGMTSELTSAFAQAGAGPLNKSLLDADYYLAVARSLLAGTTVSPVLSADGQITQVNETLASIRAEQLKLEGNFMGFCRLVDFSQFRVRGHYTHSDRLIRYFQCMAWLGRTDIPVAGTGFERCPGDLRTASPRELGAAIVLWHLVNASGQFENWRDMERIIQTFIGPTDSMTFGQLGGVLAGAGIQTLGDIQSLATLEKIQAELLHGELGVQNIRSDWFQQPLGVGAQYALPQTFTVFGQKFVPDSWAFSQTVFSSISSVEDGVTNKVQRRVPGALDVAFSILGNDQIVPELVAQMKGQSPTTNRLHAMRFRDGLAYQHNLAAVRNVVDMQTPESWDSNLYAGWLACLRELSGPTTGINYPEAMRTRAWALKTVNTQLASWTQLRHDTILYAKQSYTDGGSCVYPTGFIEPRIDFWNRLERLANHAADAVSALHFKGNYALIHDVEGKPVTNFVSNAQIQSRQSEHLRNFARTVAQLRVLAEKELAHECFSGADESFIDHMMEGSVLGDCGELPRYDGWYPQLFYRAIYANDKQFHLTLGASAFDSLVADVHTDVPCAGCNSDPGSVLHEAVGYVNMLVLAVDNGLDRFVCAGPVLSHYEFEVLGEPRRFSDREWRELRNHYIPDDVPASHLEGLDPPEWTRGFLVRKP